MADEPKAGDPGAASRTGMAAERTWLAWWRTAIGATAGALGVGRIAPDALNVPSAYTVGLDRPGLGCVVLISRLGRGLIRASCGERGEKCGSDDSGTT